MFLEPTSPTDRIQGRLLLLAGIFLFLFAVILTLSPSVRVRSWDADYRWDHWLGLSVWAIVFTAAHVQTSKRLPDRDPYLLPVAALLSGWGMLTIWRLLPIFGQRQAIWLIIALALFIYALRLSSDLSFLRRYKYFWLTCGLLLTALTFLMGTNPTHPSFPRLWLGGQGMYLQPSEPLKLLLVIYLAAYLAGSNGKGAAPVLKVSSSLAPLLAPTVIMTGLAMLLLFFQRDLGTATLFLFLYAITVYLASGKKFVLILTASMLALSAVAGYSLFDVVRIRVDAWLNPWLDPSGRSYQLVQSLLSIANGGLFGRGPGLGSPGLVPVPHSDFIFSAIVEEGGLLAAVGLLAAFGLLCARGLRAALRSPDAYRRYLAAGLTAYLVAQGILIISGNMRLLPLTGVTLPFVSYGGSSLVTSFMALLLLLHVSNHGDAEPLPISNPAPYLFLGGLLFSGLFAAALLTGWWAVYRGPDLLTRADNVRLTIADRFVPRGDIIDRNNQPIVRSTGTPGNYFRTSYYPNLSLVTGYTNPVYGQSGIEASLNTFLRGLDGYPEPVVWWDHLVFGQPPAGLDIRLTIDLDLQRVADELLHNRQGALVLLNAQSGEILAIASHPNYDPNTLAEDLPDLVDDPGAPLLNRASQGLYQPGPSLAPLMLAAILDPELSSGRLPSLPQHLSYQLETGASTLALDCAILPEPINWGTVVSSGCPSPAIILGTLLQESLTLSYPSESAPLTALFQRWGLYSTPALRIPAASLPLQQEEQDLQQVILGQGNLQVSPIQLGLAISALSADGLRPAPRLAAAYDSPENGWMPLPRLEESRRIFHPEAARSAIQTLNEQDGQIWQSLAVAINGPDEYITWYLGGSGLAWSGTPLAIVVLLEDRNPTLAQEIGQAVLRSAMQP